MVVIYEGSYPWKYFLINGLTSEAYEVSEKEFFELVGTDRDVVPMEYEKGNVNRQNFFLDNNIIGYRERQVWKRIM